MPDFNYNNMSIPSKSVRFVVFNDVYFRVPLMDEEIHHASSILTLNNLSLPGIFSSRASAKYIVSFRQEYSFKKKEEIADKNVMIMMF